MATNSSDPENSLKTAASAEGPQEAPSSPEVSRSVVNAMMLKLC